ncbi:MAG TPA: exonuclease domain-containing protein [Desulfuromonadales bacterium]|nr:exonuclease domain-containing protein [Desulfuromonadales bacterium]
MIPQQLAIVDLETTGTNPRHDRITEIGVCEMRDGAPGEEWSTLVNPGRRLSPFIERLTGIRNEMLVEAPRFADVAEALRNRLTGKVLVAHNARFDYGFLQSEFQRLGLPFDCQVLCTVKLSRRLFSQHRRHNLDTLIERYGLAVSDRHRALGDARAVREFLIRLQSEVSADALQQAVLVQLRQPSMPPHLAKTALEELPNGPGVYLFHGENDTLLYIGKSIAVRTRVRSHFADAGKNTKGMKLYRQVRRIDVIETAGELGALLLEARLVKQKAPIHNRRLRRCRDLFSIRLNVHAGDHPRPEIAALKNLSGDDLEHLFGLYRSRREAEKSLREIITAQGLCSRVLGLEQGRGACFGYQIKQCRGACLGLEPVPLHNARLLNALAAVKVRSWPFRAAVGIRETSPVNGRIDIHVFDRWCHLGTAHDEDGLQEIIDSPQPLPFDLDCYRILTRYLDRPGNRSDRINLPRPRPAC